MLPMTIGSINRVDLIIRVPEGKSSGRKRQYICKLGYRGEVGDVYPVPFSGIGDPAVLGVRWMGGNPNECMLVSG